MHRPAFRCLWFRLTSIALRTADQWAPSAGGPPLGVLLQSDRRLQGDHVEAEAVAGGSIAGPHERPLTGT